MAAVPFLPPASSSWTGASSRPDVLVDAGRRRIRHRRSSLLAALPMTAAAVVLVLDRSVVVRAVGKVAGLRPLQLLLVLAVLLAQKAATASVHHGATEGVSWIRAAVASEAHLGASNAVIGGSGIGTGVRVAMLRSWGVDPMDVATAVTLTATAPALAMWGIAVLHTAPDVVLGRADRLTTAVMLGGMIVWIVSALVVAHLVRDVERLVRPAAWLHRRRDHVLETSTHPVAVRVRRRVGHRSGVRVDLVGGARRLHEHLSSMVRRRGARVLVTSVVAQLLTAVLLVVCVQVLGPAPQGWRVLAVLRAYALLRVLTSFVPIPGGIGVLDLGLLGVLARSGVDRATAVAALGLFRSLTFALPLVTGPLATVWWQLGRRRLEPSGVRRS